MYPCLSSINFLPPDKVAPDKVAPDKIGTPIDNNILPKFSMKRSQKAVSV